MKIIISFVVLSSFFCTVNSQGNRPSVTGEILPQVQRKGETAKLTCTVIQMSSQAKVQWVKDNSTTGKPVTISDGQKIFGNFEIEGKRKYDIEITPGQNNGFDYALVVRALTKIDNGSYTCQIRITNLPYDEWPEKKTGHLTVEIAPLISFNTQSVITMTVGENATLECEADGIPSPNITWKRGNGKELPHGGFVHRGGVYHITGVNYTDRGQFICTADNNVKPVDTYDVLLNVRFEPHCEPMQDTVGQKQNFDAKLECKVAANPEAEVIWYVEDQQTNQLQQINDNDVYTQNQMYLGTLKRDEKMYTLLIKNVQSGHYTNFYCSATNPYGTNMAKLEVFETMECQGQNCPSISAGRGTPVCRLSTAALLLSLIVCIVTNKHFQHLF